MSAGPTQQGLAKASVKMLVFSMSLSALPFIFGPTGCANAPEPQTTGDALADNANAPAAYDPSQVEDRRTAERVREALAAVADYKYDRVKVLTTNGSVELSGFVDTTAQRQSAAAIARKVLGVTGVKNHLTVKD